MLNEIKLRDKLPKVPPGFYAPFDERKLSEDERLILSAARARDPSAAKHYLESKEVESALDVEDLFQAAPVPKRRQRFINWLRRLFGESQYDTAISQYYRDERLKEKGIFVGELRIGNRKRESDSQI